MGRKTIAIYSVFGILLYVIFGFWAFGLSFGEVYSPKEAHNFLRIVQSGVWTIATLPLIFMVYFDVKRRTQINSSKEGSLDVTKSPIIWSLTTLAFGPIAGFVYYYSTRGEKEIQELKKSDNLNLVLSIITIPLAIMCPILYLWSSTSKKFNSSGISQGYNMFFYMFIVLIVTYILLNIFLIYRMKLKSDYRGIKILLMSFILFVILFWFFH